MLNKNAKYNYLNRLKRNFKYQKNQDNFKKTFSEGFNQKEYKKTLLKSSSEIMIENEKFNNFKDVYNNNNININNISLFKQYRNQSSKVKDNKTLNSNKNFFDIDNFNKNIITGKASNQYIMYNKIVLPKLSTRSPDSNFNKTMLNFNRERTKKVVEGFSHKNNSMNMPKSKKTRTVKFI